MDYNKIGHESLFAFVRTVQKVVTDRGPFDYIVAASDSGNLATLITEKIYSALKIVRPREFCAPIFRHIDKERTTLFDNTILKNKYDRWGNKDFGDVLFVDDEIWRANALNGMLDLLFSLDVKINSLTIVAEDGGFIWLPTMRGISTTYVATKKRIPGIYNAFSYTIPDKFLQPVKKILEGEPMLNNKQIMCTLLNKPIKERDNGIPYFSERFIQLSTNKIPNFKSIQKEYEEWLRNIISRYLY